MVNKSFDFQFCFPVELQKSSTNTEDGEWRIRGLASTSSQDLQGEIVNQDGLDISALKAGLGLFNYDHEKGPENIIGVIDGAEVTPQGLMVEGYLLKEQPRARAFYDIMRSLKPEHSRRVQFSIEGKIVKREGDGGRTIANAKVEKVALTVDPVNTDTYVEMLKSLSIDSKDEPSNKSNQEDVNLSKSDAEVYQHKLKQLIKIRLLKKALSAGTGYTGAPTDMSGGEVLTSESLDREVRDLKSFDEETMKTIKNMAEDLSSRFPHMDKIEVEKSIFGRVQELALN